MKYLAIVIIPLTMAAAMGLGEVFSSLLQPVSDALMAATKELTQESLREVN